MKKSKYIIPVILCLVIVLTAFSLPAKAEETHILPCTTSLFSGEVIHKDIEYKDSFFDSDPSEYNHELARASLGLAISSYRNNVEKDKPTDAWITEYVKAAGFTGLSPEWYDNETGEHTVSSMIAHKIINDYTLIVAVPCGGGYGNEWLSNFSVGSGERHEGFNEAAQMVEARILEYIKKYNITGDIKLWMAGYSRGAATANLVEADMTDSGLFKAVYGYNFAVPRNTKSKDEYNNIFNILGKFDPVTMIPIAEWGYVRYGTDLFTPAQENDSNYGALISNATNVSMSLIGSRFYNSPETNSQLHMMLEYLLQILPADSVYEKSLQSSLKKAWVNMMDLDQLLQVLNEAFANMTSLDAEQQTNAKALVSFLESVVLIHLQGNTRQINQGFWDTEESLASNIIREHNPNTYVEWMFSSDDPAEIFDNCPVTNRIVITGKIVADIYDENGFIESIDLNDNISYDAPEGEMRTESDVSPSLYALRQGSQTIISVPGDREYRIKLHVGKSNTIGYLCTRYNVEGTEGITSRLATVNSKKGDVFILTVKPYDSLSTDDSNNIVSAKDSSKAVSDYIFISKEDGSPVDIWYSDLPYSPSMLMQLENVNVFHLSLTSLIIAIVCIIVFIVLLIIAVIIIAATHAIKCRKRGKPFSKYYVIIPHLMLILLFFLVAEISGYLMPAIKVLPPLLITLASIIMVLLACRGNIRHTCRRNTIILLALFLCTIASFFLMFYTRVGVVRIFQFICMCMYFIIGCIAAIYTFPHEGKIRE